MFQNNIKDNLPRTRICLWLNMWTVYQLSKPLETVSEPGYFGPKNVYFLLLLKMWKTFPIIKAFVNHLLTRVFWPRLCSFWCYWQSEKFSNYQNLCQPSYILAPGVLFNVIDNLNSFQILSTKFSLFFPGSPSPHILTNIIGSSVRCRMLETLNWNDLLWTQV